jgi:hypothetical protein
VVGRDGLDSRQCRDEAGGYRGQSICRRQLSRQYRSQTENADLRETFLLRGPEAAKYLEANSEVGLQPVKIYPDYYPDLPGATAGGRVLEPVAFDGAQLGKSFARLRPPLPEFTLFGGMMVNRLDIPHLRRFGRSFRSTARSIRLVSRYALQRLRAPRGTTLHLGNALAARLYASLLRETSKFCSTRASSA